jgi:hypothetical protein
MEKRNKYKKFHGKIIRFLTLILALTLTCIFSCAQIEKAKDKTSIKDIVMSYNKGIVDVARSSTREMKSLESLASKDVLQKLYYWLAAWEESNAYMDGTLKDIQFTKVDLSGQTAKVLTAEDWVYEYRDRKTKQVILPAVGRFYEMEYVLQKIDGTWIITAVNIKSEKKDEK